MLVAEVRVLTPGDYLIMRQADEGTFLAWLEGGGSFLVRVWYYDDYGWSSGPACEGYRYKVMGGPNGHEDLSVWPKHWRWRPITPDLLTQWAPS